ncbi:MAG: hypothetical protein RBT16_14330, partial [Desulfococcus multivorans]|nr:hypothetical protein [Desulfococcus multivorans]
VVPGRRRLLVINGRLGFRFSFFPRSTPFRSGPFGLRAIAVVSFGCCAFSGTRIPGCDGLSPKGFVAAFNILFRI